MSIYSEMLSLALEEHVSTSDRPVAELIADVLSGRARLATVRGARTRMPREGAADRIADTLSYDVALVRLCDRLGVEHGLTGETSGPVERARAEANLADRLPSIATAVGSPGFPPGREPQPSNTLAPYREENPDDQRTR